MIQDRAILEAALVGFRARMNELNDKIRELQRELGTNSRNGKEGQTRRGISDAGRRRIAEAQRRRWAKLKKPAATAPKRHVSDEGRKRIVAAVKKRWAAYRASKRNAR